MDSTTHNTFTSHEMAMKCLMTYTVFNFTETEHCSLISEIS